MEWVFRASSPVRFSVTAGVILASLVIHAGGLFALSFLRRMPSLVSDRVDLEIVEAAPPEPVVEPEPPPPPPELPPAEPPPRTPRRLAKAPPPPAPPPPEPNPPPTEPEVPPVFNMGESSFSAEGGFAMQRSEGNTTLGPVGRKTAGRPTRPPGLPGGTGTAAFEPLPSTRISRGARVLREVRAPYPEQARDAGIEGVVLLQVEVTRAGAIRSVRVLQDPGYGLGVAAARALRAFRFSPAVDSQGTPADSRFTYTYRFELDY